MSVENISSLAARCENYLQLGGIRTGSLDYPNPLGGLPSRVAHINSGNGFRAVVAIDRGGDLVEASFGAVNLAYLSPNDYKPPNHAYHRDAEWLTGWPGGLMTTCGPGRMGEPRTEGGENVSLHGRFSSTPAAVLEVTNPNFAAGETEMRIALRIRDTRVFGPSIEITRTWRCDFGQAVLKLEDRVQNVGDELCAHGILYHINLGYPLLDEGARLVLSGHATGACLYEGYSTQQLESLKNIPGPNEKFRGNREGLIITEPTAGKDGWIRTGLINPQRTLGLEISYPPSVLPRLANWQHFGPRGSYATALEPFSGSLFGVALDDHPGADLWLSPGETRRYELQFRVCETAAEINGLASWDREFI